MKNYFNFKKFREKILLTNDCGHYAFVSQETFRNIILDQIDRGDHDYERLLREGFLYDDVPEAFVSGLARDVRLNKQYLLSGTSLFIFVLTNVCNMNCVYCQAQDESSNKKGWMTKEIAEKAVDIALQSPEKVLQFEFQGGEPLLNFDVLQYIVSYSQKNKADKIIRYSVVTNSLLLTDEKMDFFRNNFVAVSTSLDGDLELQSINRPTNSGVLSFEWVKQALQKAKSRDMNVGAILTTTRYSLNSFQDIVDTYVSFGLQTIFVRPLSPLGYAKEHWDEIGYLPEEFVAFYQNLLHYLIELNKKGIFIREGHARIFLKKILGYGAENYMELRSPCGAVNGQIAFYYDGSIYTCDEGRMVSEMGDSAFCLGNVLEKTYLDLMESGTNKAVCCSSILECLPGCCDCVYQPYCGVCPVINYAMYQNLYTSEPQNYRCAIYKGMLDCIFQVIYEDENNLNIFQSWIEGEKNDS